MCAEEKPSRVNSFQSFNGLTYQGDTQIKQSVALSSKIHCMMRKCDMLNFASNFFLRRNTRFEISNLHDNGGRYQRIVTCIAQKWKKKSRFLVGVVLFAAISCSIYSVLLLNEAFYFTFWFLLSKQWNMYAFCTGVSMHYAHTQSTNELLHKFIAL